VSTVSTKRAVAADFLSARPAIPKQIVFHFTSSFKGENQCSHRQALAASQVDVVQAAAMRPETIRRPKDSCQDKPRLRALSFNMIARVVPKFFPMRFNTQVHLAGKCARKNRAKAQRDLSCRMRVIGCAQCCIFHGTGHHIIRGGEPQHDLCGIRDFVTC